MSDVTDSDKKKGFFINASGISVSLVDVKDNLTIKKRRQQRKAIQLQQML